ncbi:MAG: hypothetical protein OEV79_10465 [candidate division WOR-3 bacterium]|nr:hypothetical protein [candidate division WOR-3 bacterium]
MVGLILCFLIHSNVYPQNALWDRYTILAPLGTIKSLATSNQNIFALSDDYLLLINKNSLELENTVYINRGAQMVGYDNYTTDLWIVCSDNIIRFSTASFNIREFPIHFPVNRFAIDANNLYMETVKTLEKYSLDKVIGTLTKINSFPQNLNWHKRISDAEMRQYPFLSPYYYSDDIEISQTPFEQYPITALHDDGMYLYVGTHRYGILKYNKISWQSQRIITGPLDSGIKTIRKVDGKILIISKSGISYFAADTRSWHYQRFRDLITDVISYNDDVYIAQRNRVLKTTGSMEFPTETFSEDVLTLQNDNRNIYIGTRSGAFRIIEGSGEAMLFGPTTGAVYAIHPTPQAVYVGGEFGLYKYEKEGGEWSTQFNFGTKDIVQVHDNIYILGTNNQIIRLPAPVADSMPDNTGWDLLPYFNIYDIDTDGAVIYCATYSGIYYYDPGSKSYRIIYNLPRIQYEHVYVIDDRLMAISDNIVYLLPLEYRD